ncbi:MAG: flavodoxin-dependent (E)-4-hydroxy-3-methylbut-2-enyl-diphosphate synthase, partial [Rikenellaceae bacterium]|nr:flavodoxin-dependent (E)-4-hydroxy-3-methylbut-2-enyl-diphosphate synthase [Rikenellaceae bacterium]
TEAGAGEEARVKSAAGIGALLADGLGDTIRVSLTEPPEAEIPVARKLAGYFCEREQQPPVPVAATGNYTPMTYHRRETTACGITGGNFPPVVVGAFGPGMEPAPDLPPDHPEFLRMSPISPAKALLKLNENPEKIILLEGDTYHSQRAFFLNLEARNLHHPVIIRRSYAETDLETLQLKAAADIGPLLLDGFGDGIMIENHSDQTGGHISPQAIASLSFALLQAARVRISRTEYITCPGCGRTLFDLPQTLSRVREATKHYKGLKIGVMGCIVNGPGEMADADYGYVGAGPGRVTLYKGKTVIKRNIPQQEAIEELLALIAQDHPLPY